MGVVAPGEKKDKIIINYNFVGHILSVQYVGELSTKHNNFELFFLFLD